MPELILKAEKITKNFLSPSYIQIFREINIELYSGQSIAIMGASGEGKSTLLHILGTLEKPTSGDLTICGRSVALHPSPAIRNRYIGFVFQSYNLLDHYTVLQNVLMPALIGKRDISKGSVAYANAVELIGKVGLTERLNYSARLLSGGEKQRVSIARALCNDPAIILADEPSGNLDHHTSSFIHKLLIDSTKELRKGLIVVTHDQELAEMCDFIFYLRDGHLVEHKDP